MSITRHRLVGQGRRPAASVGAWRARQKFLRFFPEGFTDQKYIDWERGYKWRAHLEWTEALNRDVFRALLRKKQFSAISARAVRIESRTNLLFSFEKMALRDAVKTPAGAGAFARGLFAFLHGDSAEPFEEWINVVGSLPRRQTRVLTWPVVTVFGFIAEPERHFFLKPNVTKLAAADYGFDLQYQSRPSALAYARVLEFADVVRRDLRDLGPRDMIDIQSFLWVQGSSEYEE